MNFLAKLLLVGIFLVKAHATEQALTLASGYGAAHIVPLRVSLKQVYSKVWRQNSSWPLGWYVEASYYNMRGKPSWKVANSNKSLQAGACALVLLAERALPYHDIYPYIELGFGASLLSKNEIGGRRLGGQAQFEDRLGLGIRFGQDKRFELGYKAIHFSNAYLASYNHGINLHVLSLGFWF